MQILLILGAASAGLVAALWFVVMIAQESGMGLWLFALILGGAGIAAAFGGSKKGPGDGGGAEDYPVVGQVHPGAARTGPSLPSGEQGQTRVGQHGGHGLL